MPRRSTLLAIASFGLLALFALIASPAFASSGGGDDFKLSDLIPLGSAALGAGLASAATLRTTKTARDAQRQDVATALGRERQERLALEMKTLAEQATALYDRLLVAVEEGLEPEKLAGITQPITELSQRRHFIVDPELRDRTSKFLNLANKILQAADRETGRELLRSAGPVAESIGERAGELYRQAMIDRFDAETSAERAGDPNSGTGGRPI